MIKVQKNNKIREYGVFVNQTDISERFSQPDLVEWIVDVLLSKPTSKRFSDTWGNQNVLEVLRSIFSQRDEADTLTVYNGSYRVTLTFGQWYQFLNIALQSFRITEQPFGGVEVMIEGGKTSSAKTVESVDLSDV